MAITKQQFSTLEDLFDFYNYQLFEGELPACLVNLSRHRGAYGIFAAERWKDNKRKIIHEISLNPDLLNRADKHWHSTLVHEMAHLWEEINGYASRRGYHNQKWADKMMEVGLMPSNTGRRGGKTTGQRVSHYVIQGGVFDLAFTYLKMQNLVDLKLPYMPNRARSRKGGKISKYPTGMSGVKIKYTCACNYRVWGKSGLSIKCLICDKKFMPVKDSE